MAFGTAILLASYALVPLPIDPKVGNVNKIHGPSETAPQTWMDPRLWVLTLVVGTIVVIYLPTHAALARWTPPRKPSRT